jgi:ankyrin repeat protein
MATAKSKLCLPSEVRLSIPFFGEDSFAKACGAGKLAKAKEIAETTDFRSWPASETLSSCILGSAILGRRKFFEWLVSLAEDPLDGRIGRFCVLGAAEFGDSALFENIVERCGGEDFLKDDTRLLNDCLASAALAGSISLVERLLSLGANPADEKSDRSAILCAAAGGGKNAEAIARMLVSHGANIDKASAATGYWTPLTFFVDNALPGAVEILLLLDANPQIVARRTSALDRARDNCSYDDAAPEDAQILEMLEQHLAKKEREAIQVDLPSDLRPPRRGRRDGPVV